MEKWPLVPDDVGVFVFLHLLEEGDLSEGGHGHALLAQGHPHLLQRHHLALVGRVPGLVHRPVSTYNDRGNQNRPLVSYSPQ